MYAIVKTGGKQYRVEEGQSLLVERLPGDDGAKIPLRPLLYVDGDTVVDGEELAKVSVEARVLSQERGPKLRIVKFKPKRGYKRRTGHRQDLTRIEVTGIKLGTRKAASKQTPTPVAAEASGAAATDEKPARSRAKPAAAAEKSAAGAAKPAAAAKKPAAGAAKPARSRAKPASGPEADESAPGTEAAAKPAAKKPARTRSKPATTESTPEEGNGA